MLAIFFAILAFCLLTKLYRLDYPKDFYFDEVYHGFTATYYLHGDKQAYDPWAQPPAGKGFEWTHPPLAKLVMAGMMALFGENPFAWRIGSVIFGSAATVATAVLCFELFGSIAMALMAMALMSLETLVLAQSRIAMNDSYFVFFMLAGLIAYVRWRRSETSIKYLYLTGLALGLALATKWTALYIFLIIAIDLAGFSFWSMRLPYRGSWLHFPVALGALPVLVYIASYLHYFSLGYGWSDFVSLLDQMWRYHSGLKSSHNYQSQPWQWILNLRPVWFYGDFSVPAGTTANIYNLGNTIILYAGLYSVFSTIVFDKTYRNTVLSWQVWFLLITYFMLWLPWTLSPRIMFFYHYMPAIPLLCIVLARWLEQKLSSCSIVDKRVAKSVLAAAFVWFVVYYPDNTGISVPQAFADRVYFSVPGWRY